MSSPTNQRQHQRVAVSLSMEVEYDGSIIVAKVRDLSEGGAGLMSRKPIPEEVEVDIMLILAEEGIADPNQPPIKCKAKVMWSVEQQPGQVSAGIRFVSLDEQTKLRIRWFVAQLSDDN